MKSNTSSLTLVACDIKVQQLHQTSFGYYSSVPALLDGLTVMGPAEADG